MHDLALQSIVEQATGSQAIHCAALGRINIWRETSDVTDSWNDEPSTGPASSRCTDESQLPSHTFFIALSAALTSPIADCHAGSLLPLTTLPMAVRSR